MKVSRALVAVVAVMCGGWIVIQLYLTPQVEAGMVHLGYVAAPEGATLEVRGGRLVLLDAASHLGGIYVGGKIAPRIDFLCLVLAALLCAIAFVLMLPRMKGRG